MRRTRLVLLLPLCCAIGCPVSEPVATLTAAISLSTSSGPAPLTVMLSSLGTTTVAAITSLSWDFGDGATANDATPTHTFEAPGRYRVTLTVEDAEGATSSAVESVRVQGGPAMAAIAASVTTGSAPLGVVFDGSGSSAADDKILDYYWDLGDGETARVAQPVHVYQVSGTYIVALRAVTGGGVEATATTIITVTQAVSGSLQFNGMQFATLPVAAGTDLATWTFETWALPGDAGGQVVSFGAPNVAISLDSNARLVRIVANSINAQVSTPELGSGWHHLAVTFAEGTVDVFLDGSTIGTAALDAATTGADLLLGSGYRGNLYDARIWSLRREATDIAAGRTSPPAASADGLLGRWPLDEGSGQTLANRATGGASGVRGASDSAESPDPAWSSEAP